MGDYDDVARQHASLLADVDRLTLMLAAPDDTLAQARIRMLWLEDLASLAGNLARHFAEEEEGGYLEMVTGPRPGLSRRVDALRGQHREITAGLAALQSTHATLELDQLRRRARAVLGRLREHEAQESALVRRTLTEDIGTAD